MQTSQGQSAACEDGCRVSSSFSSQSLIMGVRAFKSRGPVCLAHSTARDLSQNLELGRSHSG